jgi:uncharacterized protein YdaU (DUF1376 family)
MSRPYFKLYGRDFRDGVRPLTLEETGAYTLLLTLIYDAGGPIPDDGEAIRRQLGCDRRVWARIRGRLLDLGKLQLTEDGCLTNERAEREIADQARVSEVRSDAGRVGGERSGAARRRGPQGGSGGAYGTSSGKVGQKSGKSPADFSSLTPPNPLESIETPEANASKAIPEPLYNRSAKSAGAQARPPDLGGLAACLAAAGPGLADPAREQGLHLTAPRIAAWLAAGCDLEADVLPIIRARTAQARASPITTWSYFERAVIDARDRRLAMPPPPDPARFQTVPTAPGAVHGQLASPTDRPRPLTTAERIREERYDAWRSVFAELEGVAGVGETPAAA